MKKRIFALVMILSMATALFCTTANASDYFDGQEQIFGDFRWVKQYKTDGSYTIMVTKYIGYDTEVTVPEKIDEKPVTDLFYLAFNQNDIIKKVQLPKTLKVLSCNSWNYSTTMGKGWNSTNGGAFYGCTSLTSVNIPSNVNKIGAGAFNKCSSLKSISIPSSVKTIDGQAFSDCTSLTEIKLPEGVESIGYSCFSGCKNLKSIDLPSGLKEIKESAFSRCQSLKSIVIPNSVKNLNPRTFENCTSLTSLTIPAGVTMIDINLFGKSDYNKNLVIYCASGSQAEKFAKAKGIKTGAIGSEPNPQDTVFGDMDGDGMTTAADSLSILRMSVNLEPKKDGADVDGDGNVTSADSLMVLRYSVGLK